MKKIFPLAERMRPENIEDIVGQDHILGKGKYLRLAIEKDDIPSFIMWGPPGCGKTSIANIIKKHTASYMVSLPAVSSSIKEVKEVIKEAKIRLRSFSQKTILFIDEIHRFNKAQQDFFLPYVEKGIITIIGATTENPYFEVISPLLSRVKVLKLNPLTEDDITQIIKHAIKDPVKGLGKEKINIDEEALALLSKTSYGDARIALNSLEMAFKFAQRRESNTITCEDVQAVLQKKVIYDKGGDAHYHHISAFIKSVRGSDPDAALYYMAKMLCAGEDPRFIARRLIILAAEDIGLADPFALNVATAAAHAVEYVGMPEAKIILSEATIYLASAPKSNTAYMAIKRAWEMAEKGPATSVPLSLRNPTHKALKEEGYGRDYKYAHQYPDHFAAMEFLPKEIKDARFYYPENIGYEKKIKARLNQWWKGRFNK